MANDKADTCYTFLARLIFVSEDRGDMSLRNVGSYMDYTALYPRIWQSKVSITSNFINEFLLKMGTQRVSCEVRTEY
jgi:hypothetical protein